MRPVLQETTTTESVPRQHQLQEKIYNTDKNEDNKKQGKKKKKKKKQKKKKKKFYRGGESKIIDWSFELASAGKVCSYFIFRQFTVRKHNNHF